MKKLFFFLAMILLPMMASAHDIEVQNADGVTIYYNYTNNGTELAVTYRGSTPTSYYNNYRKVVIPEAVTFNGNAYSVTSIGDDAFRSCSRLTSITIPNSVRSIDNGAFYDCSGLTSFTIPSSVTSIGFLAFYGCSGLTSVTIPNNVRSIEEMAFDHCSGLISMTVESENFVYDSRNGCNAIIETATNTLIAGCKNTIIPNSVKSIGDYAFGGCSGLTSITIPNSVTNIGRTPFEDCSGLTSMTVESGNSVYDSRNGCNAIIETATNTLIAGCKNTIIPNSVKSIGNCAFYGCSGLTSIIIPNSVTSIGNYAFYGCSGLTSITIGNSVTSIGDHAFYGCSGLTSVTIPNSVTYIGRGVFERCSGLTSVTIGNSVTSIGAYAFYYCSGLTSITIPNSVTSIGDHAFYGCSGLTSIIIPNSVTSISYAAFYGCSGLTSVTIPNSVTSISYAAFVGCTGLTSMSVESENSVYDSRNGCNAIIETATNTLIAGCKNTIIPNNVTNIGDYAFRGCSGLTSVTIPNSVTDIGAYAFTDCGLTCVKVLTTTPPIAKSNSFNKYEIPLYVPAESVDAYKAADPWKKFKEFVPLGETIERTIHISTAGTLADKISEAEKYTIDKLVLTGELNGTDFRLLRDMAGNNYLGQNTEGKLKMLDLSGAKVVTGGEKYLDTDQINGNGVSVGGSFHYQITQVDEIPTHVFFCCYLKNILIPNSLTSIGESAFSYCRDITSITIPNSVTTIGNSAFESCSGLTLITIPNSVTSIGDGAFSDCRGLTSVTIPNSVTSIGERAFSGCSDLSSIKVDNNNPKYDSRNNCNAIIETSTNTLIIGCKNTVIPYSVTSIANYSFYYCRGLTSITIPNSVSSIGHFVFYGCSGLISITIPYSVASIGNYAFCCSGLTDVISKIQNPFEIKESVFSSNTYSKATLTVPSSTKTKYQQTNYWNKFTNIIEDTSTSRTIHVYPAGSLPSLISESEKYTIEELTLTGELNGTDFRLLRDMAGCNYLGEITSGKLTVLDLANTKVVAGGEKYLDTGSIRNRREGNIFGDFYNYTIEENDILPKYVFCFCDLSTIVIPNSVTSIDYGAFYYCDHLISISFPYSVTTIGGSAFAYCSGLPSINIPNSVKSIGTTAFDRCSGLISITVESGNTVYDSREDCNAIISTIDDKLVLGCKNTVIPNSVTGIGDFAFSGCGITSITIPNSVTSIGRYAFNNCSSLTSITIPNSVTSIGYGTFQSCIRLTSITIPNSVTSIGDYAFQGCSRLTSITIPNSVMSIGYRAFEYCRSLTSVTVEKFSPISITEDVFTNRANATLYVPKGSKSAYEAADYWKEFKEIVEYDTPTDISTLTDAIYADAAMGAKGCTTNLTINLKNAQATNAYSFDLKLPEGVTVVKDNDNEFIYTLSDRHNSHTVEAHYAETTGVYSFAVLSVQSRQLTGNDGAVMTLKLKVADDVALGDYLVKIQNAKYSLPDGSGKISMPETIAKLSIENYVKGDVNGDSDVDIADAVCIVNYVVGKQTPKFNIVAADANVDGAVDIADAVRIVNLVVGKISALAPRFEWNLPEPE